MTTNQLILLFDIHRGFTRECHPATFDQDLKYLHQCGLVTTPEMPSISHKGLEVVESVLNLFPKRN